FEYAIAEPVFHKVPGPSPGRAGRPGCRPRAGGGHGHCSRCGAHSCSGDDPCPRGDRSSGGAGSRQARADRGDELRRHLLRLLLQQAYGERPPAQLRHQAQHLQPRPGRGRGGAEGHHGQPAGLPPGPAGGTHRRAGERLRARRPRVPEEHRAGLRQLSLREQAPGRRGQVRDARGRGGHRDQGQLELLALAALRPRHPVLPRGRARHPAHNDKVSFTGMLVNGWNDVVDNNSGKTWGLSATLKPSAKLTLVQNFIGGPEQKDDAHDKRFLTDTVLTVTPTEKVSLMANYDYGKDKVAGTDVKWQGIALYVRLQATRWWALT